MQFNLMPRIETLVNEFAFDLLIPWLLKCNTKHLPSEVLAFEAIRVMHFLPVSKHMKESASEPIGL